jgi:ureidoacrylate peracid hydrolase
MRVIDSERLHQVKHVCCFSRLGYEVTVVKDATASCSDEEMHAALDVDIPNYASAIMTTDQIVDSLSSVRA